MYVASGDVRMSKGKSGREKPVDTEVVVYV
jgi:hypothetical protein